MVYRLLLTGRTIQLVASKDMPYQHINRVRSRFRSKRVPRDPNSPILHLVDSGAHVQSPQSSTQLKENPPFMSLLLTCSQIHREAHLLPYASNTFSVPCHLLFYFLELRTQSQLRALGSLDLRARVWAKNNDQAVGDLLRTIADVLPGLKRLGFQVELHAKVAEMGSKAQWVKGVEAWMGRGLEIGLIDVTVLSFWYNSLPKKLGDLGKELSERLTARQASCYGI